MQKETKFLWVATVIALILSTLGVGIGIGNKSIITTMLMGDQKIEVGGTPGNLLAENYLPYVQYNGGYNSAKPITTTDTLTAATIASTGAITSVTTITAGTGLEVSTGDTNVDSFVQGGDVTGFTVSTTATSQSTNTFSASNICDQSYLPITIGNTTTPTIAFPTAALLYADCLTANGDTLDLVIANTSAVTSTYLIAGTSSTIYTASSTVTAYLGPSAYYKATFLRTAIGTLKIFLSAFK